MKLKQYRDANGKGKLGGKRKTAVVDTAKSDTDSDEEASPRKAKKVRMTEPRPRSIKATAVTDDDHDGGAWITVERVTKKDKAKKRKVNNELEAQAVLKGVSKQDKAKKRKVNNELEAQAVLKGVSKQDKAKKRKVNNELEAQAVDEAEKSRLEKERKMQLDAEAQFGRSSYMKGEKESKRMKV
jgi:hypothetical protein